MKSIIRGLIVLLKAENVKPDDQAYAEELGKLNLTLRNVCPLDFAFCNLDKLRESVFSPEKYGGIVFTSPRAVEAVSRALERNETSWASLKFQWSHLTVFAVGETTSQLAESLLGLTSTGKETGNAETLAAFIKDVYPRERKPLLLPCGSLKRDTLTKNLGEAGINVETIKVYETVCHPFLKETLEKLMEKGVPEYIVYFSPSGVGFSADVLRKLNISITPCKLVAIGPTTADAIRSKGWTVYCVAAKPSATGLVEAIAAARALEVQQ